MAWRPTILPLLACSTILTGCTGTLPEALNTPITSDHLYAKKDTNKLKSMTGSRRLIRVGLRGAPDSFDVCAETWADALEARSAKSNLAIKTGQSLAEESTAALTATYARTEVSDVVRQHDWQLCNAYLNNIITKVEYRDQLFRDQDAAYKVLLAKATPK